MIWFIIHAIPESISRTLVKRIYNAVVHRKMMSTASSLALSYHRQPSHLAQLLVDALLA